MSSYFDSRRSPFYALNGIVSTSQPLAAEAGLEILRKGGNAADAAIATAAALAVTEPTGTGIGGDCFALYFDAQTKKVHAINGSGRSPFDLNLEIIKNAGFVNEMPHLDVNTVTVPGAVAGWEDLLSKHGTLTLKDVLPGAIKIAEQGFPVTPIISYLWSNEVQKTLNASPNSNEMLINGRAPETGQIWRNKKLASILREIMEGGSTAFYQGHAGREIIKIIQSLGGVMDQKDLDAHTSSFESPISTNFNGYTIFECPPNGQGLAALVALSIADGFNLGNSKSGTTERLHLLIEAIRLGFDQARSFVADLDHYTTPVDSILSSKNINNLRSKITPTQRLDLENSTSLQKGDDTVYLSVIDGKGNACSFINSNYSGFGTAIVPKNCGFTLQNRGAGFSLNPEHPNVLMPHKRPYHTIIPAMCTDKNGDLFSSFGVMGGYMQPQGHLQVLVSMLQEGMDPQTALNQPRFCIKDNPPNSIVYLEEGFSQSAIAGLEQIGHPTKYLTGIERSSVFGRGQIIVRDPATGTLIGGSDPRADGAAVGY
jgi:gamma-glutamyltranspeptidase/glutathione hydrolase